MSASLELDPDLPLFAKADANRPPLVLTSARSDPSHLAGMKAEIVVVGDERVDLRLALAELARRGLRIVLCEGGPTLLGGLIASDLLDEYCLTLAPMIGGDPLPAVNTPGLATLKRFRLAHVAEEDHTLFLRYLARGDVVTSSAFDSLVSALDQALLVVTTASDDQRAGCVVGFHTQCSIDPLRYSVWLSKANHTYRVALFATHLALHVPVDGDEALVELFGGTSGDDVDKFAGCEWTPGPGGVPLLAQCPNRIVLERTAQFDDGGDHLCVVGSPVLADTVDELIPLRLSAASDIEAGHTAEERATPDALESAAAGAGHAIDLSEPDGPAGT